jgi:hypothetical protein
MLVIAKSENDRQGQKDPPNIMSPKITLDQPGAYRICVQGALNQRWIEYFEDMTIAVELLTDGTHCTVLTGSLSDQAALQGVLQKLYNLGFPLLSVERALEERVKGNDPRTQS